ncbi:hypothetical protein RB199_00650 [Streptomyces libani]
MFGAGHNALGAWWWLAAAGRLGPGLGTGRWSQQLGTEVRAQQKRRLGLMEFAGDTGQQSFGQRVGVGDQGERTAFQRLIGEDIHQGERRTGGHGRAPLGGVGSRSRLRPALGVP